MAKKPDTNTVLAQKLIATQAKAQTAQARVDLVRAQIEVKGKQVTYDYSKPGGPVMKVVDRPKK